VRHARALLGLDLAPVTRWLRFVDVHYQRPPESSAPDAMETSEARRPPRPCGCLHASATPRQCPARGMRLPACA